MADGRKGSEGTAECAGAREALAAGDHRTARELAQAILADPASSAAAKAEAEGIDRATRIDRAPIIAGLVMAAILAALFAWVLSVRH